MTGLTPRNIVVAALLVFLIVLTQRLKQADLPSSLRQYAG